MTLPDATQIAAAYAFAGSIWTVFTIFGTVFALVASFKVGGWALRILRKSIPG